MRLITLAVPVLTAAYVSAHGYLHSISIDGHSYSGNRPHRANDPSPIRQVADQGPVKGTKNKDMNCGLGSPKPAAVDAEANPGDTISFEWTAIDGGRWIHEVGPMMTYMASCGDQDCSKFDSTKAKWFKIDQQGLVSGSSTWAQKQIFDQKPFKVSLPKNIAPGNYLIRQEVIALHAAVSVGGAEFYPSCSQLKIGGSGTGKPKSDELVSFPGAYDDEDAGIVVPDIFNPGFKYEFPGPKIASFVNGGGDSGNHGDDEEDSDSNSDSGSHDHPSSTVTSKKPAPTKSDENTSPDHGKPSKASSKIPSPTQNNTNVKATSRCKQKRGLRSSGMLPMADGSKMDSSVNVKRHQRHVSRVKRSSSFGLKH